MSDILNIKEFTLENGLPGGGQLADRLSRGNANSTINLGAHRQHKY